MPDCPVAARQQSPSSVLTTLSHKKNEKLEIMLSESLLVRI